MSGVRTIRRRIEVPGVGIHTGAMADVVLEPCAEPGVRFARADGGLIVAEACRVVETQRCTVLGDGADRIATVEHLLAACAGLGVAGLHVVCAGPELPIGDGSALCWIEALQAAGLTDDEPAAAFALAAPLLRIGKGGAFVAAYPAPRLSLTVAVHFDHPVVGTQVARFAAGDDFASQVAPARTFGFREEVERLLASGLARGGSLENAIVVESDGYSAPLRFENELARHKLLDLMGDLYLAGPLPAAQIIAVKPSHALNNEFARALAARRALC